MRGQSTKRQKSLDYEQIPVSENTQVLTKFMGQCKKTSYSKREEGIITFIEGHASLTHKLWWVKSYPSKDMQAGFSDLNKSGHCSDIRPWNIVWE